MVQLQGLDLMMVHNIVYHHLGFPLESVFRAVDFDLG